MPDEKQRRTFISYSRVNKEFALRLAKELRGDGYRIWLDQLDIPTGSRWDDELEKALERCEIFMVILTPAAIASENVKDEIGYAIDNGKRILPVYLETCNVPLRLRRFQYVDFTTKNYDEGVESAKQLMRSLIEEETLPRSGRVTSTQIQDAQDKVEADRKAKEEAEKLVKRETEREAKAEADRKAKEETEKLAKQKTEAERLAQVKAEADRKNKQEADRLAAQKAEREAKAEADRKAKAKAKPTQAMPVEMKAEAVSTETTQKKPISMGLVIGIVAVVGLVIAGIGFNALSNRETPATEAPVVTNPATEVTVDANITVDANTATSLPAVTDIPPTSTPVPATQAILSKFLTVNFVKDTGMDIFEVVEIGLGGDKNIDRTLSDDGLVLTLNGKDLYLYYTYKPFVYTDVAIKLRAENVGTINRNNVSLICRKNNDTWYEFSVTSDGYWFLYNYDESSAKRYTSIGNGGSNAIKTGQNVNEYEMRCIRDEISLYINGKKVKTVKSDLYAEGQVGFNISSLDLFPIEIKVSEFEISKP